MFGIGKMNAPTSGGPMSYGMFGGGGNGGGFLGGALSSAVPFNQTPVLPGGGPNMPQPVPQQPAMPAIGQAQPMNQTMVMPSGGPNVHQVKPPMPEVQPATQMPFTPQVAPPTPRQPVNNAGYGGFGFGRGPSGNAQPDTSWNSPDFMSGIVDIFNRPMPTMPNMPVPNPISQGSFMPPQFSLWGGRVAAPMPFNGMMKGMFGIR